MNPEVMKLMNIVKDANSRVDNHGESVNDVLAELCKSATLNKEEINRVVEWSNTLKQLSLFKRADDKTSEFEVADSGQVNKKIFGDPLEKESQRKTYGIGDRDLRKVASCEGTGNRLPYSEYDKDSNLLAKQAYAAVEKLGALGQEALIQRHSSKDKYMGAMLKLAYKLDLHGSEKFSEFEQGALDHYGEDCLDYLDTLEKAARFNNERLLNYSPKRVTKNSENLELLKTAMVQSRLCGVYDLAYQQATSGKGQWEEKLRESYAKRTI